MTSLGSKNGSTITESNLRLDRSRTEDELVSPDFESLPPRSSTSSPSLSLLSDRISCMNKSQINQRDIYGRNSLHLASSAGSNRLVSSLLDNHHIDTTLGDYESGYTALHRALYSGNISCAQSIMSHSRDAIRAKDRNNETPFELMNSVFLGNDGCLPDRQRIDEKNTKHEDDEDDHLSDDEGTPHSSHHAPPSRLFMFGSNSNHILGFADPDDRTNPEMVKLNRYDNNDMLPKHRFKPFVIKDIKMSKLHTVVLTNDLTNNIYICGIPRGGRLGLGQDNSSTQFTFTKVPGFSHCAIRSVGTGLDHTVVISDSHECFTFGSNRNGQLGYPIGKTKLEPSYLPKKVGGDLKRKRLVGCAASNIHTVVYTENEIYCWGKNVGQMGFISDVSSGGIPAPTGKLVSTIDNAGNSNSTINSTISNNIINNNANCIIEPLPRNMIFEIGNNSRIEMICATDIATIILLSKRQEVYVFMNSLFFKVQFPVDNNFSETKNFNSYNSQSVRGSSAYIVKISSSPNGMICAVDNIGSVYTFSLTAFFVHPSVGENNANSSFLRPSSLAKQIKVQTIWIARKIHLAVTDVDISDDGSVILCTKAGSVWKSTKSTKKNKGKPKNRNGEYKFNRIPFITRSRQVRCDANFGSFASICEDVTPPSLLIDKTNLSDDLHFIVPFISSDDDRASTRVIRDISNDDTFSRPFEIASNVGYKERKSIPLENDTQLSYIGLKSWLSSATQDGFKLSIIDIDNSRGYDLVLKVKKHVIPVHCSILSSRSKPLKGLIDGEITTLKCSGCESHIKRDKNSYKGKLVLDFSEFELATVVTLVYYLYTDYSLKPWGDFRKSVPKDISKAKQELTGLKITLGLDNFWVEVYRNEQPRRDLQRDLMKMANDAKYSDIVILLKDGKEYLAHSYILKARSGYFSTLLSERWYMNRNHNSDGKQIIDLTTIPFEIFEVVIAHIYGNKEEDIFDGIKGLETAKQFLRFALEVMAVADELILPKLRQICECTIKHFGECRGCVCLYLLTFSYCEKCWISA